MLRTLGFPILLSVWRDVLPGECVSPIFDEKHLRNIWRKVDVPVSIHLSRAPWRICNYIKLQCNLSSSFDFVVGCNIPSSNILEILLDFISIIQFFRYLHCDQVFSKALPTCKWLLAVPRYRPSSNPVWGMWESWQSLRVRRWFPSRTSPTANKWLVTH